MGALAHFIETAGIATTQISLIRLHTETIRPPRALWVPFELGRPFGVPDDPAFQHRVLKSALELLSAQSGPVIADFEEEAPAASVQDMDGWVCPMPSRPSQDAIADPAAALLSEIASLRQWHDLFIERRGRTSIGVCPMTIEDIARYLATMMAEGEAGPPPNGSVDDLTPAKILKLGSEDLKAFYSEAAIAMPGNKQSGEIEDWIWSSSELGRTLFGLKPVCLNSSDSQLQAVGKFTLVPRSQLHRAPTSDAAQDFSSAPRN
ncbi:MAG: hypothetical protein ACR2OV_04975 [Hyphomicrobiaceae bacterium]